MLLGMSVSPPSIAPHVQVSLVVLVLRIGLGFPQCCHGCSVCVQSGLAHRAAFVSVLGCGTLLPLALEVLRCLSLSVFHVPLLTLSAHFGVGFSVSY